MPPTMRIETVTMEILFRCGGSRGGKYR
ncbi:hypothetical protein A2U01_0105985, partial [Trifolium medium]|nr:hypothetical protein [Trifolium medium]